MRTPEERVEIEFLYLDLSHCTRCQTTEVSLDEALIEASRLIGEAGLEVQVRKTLVSDERQARELGLKSSPTIRVNGKDLQADVRESRCAPCGNLVGEPVDCRVWVHEGKEYAAPHGKWVVDAILRQAYKVAPAVVETPSGEPAGAKDVPDNLKRFFAAKRSQEASGGRASYRTGDERYHAMATRCGCEEACALGSASVTATASIPIVSKREACR